MYAVCVVVFFLASSFCFVVVLYGFDPFLVHLACCKFFLCDLSDRCVQFLFGAADAAVLCSRGLACSLWLCHSPP